jgi:hypothetical protein
MKYLVRAVKYFVSICLLATIILLVLVMMHAVSSDINVMFQQGWVSVGKIALMFAAVSAIYPLVGYKKQMAHVLGDLSDLRGSVVKCMEERGYKLESEDGDKMTFRSRSVLHRIFRLGEDRITIRKELGGFEVEGLSRDIVRVAYALEYKLRDPDAPQE